MKRAAFLLLMAFAMAPAPGFSEDIILFKHAYRKQPPPPPQASQYPQYRVKTGDTLRKIFLQDFGARPEELPNLYRKFKQYNPGIKDLDHILSDYQLTIPTDPQVRKKEQPSAPAQPLEGNVVVIKKGQHLAKVLREMYGLSDDVIFHEYMDKIRKLNPEIEDLDLLVAGQKVRLPAIRPAAVKPPASRQAPAPQQPAKKGGPQKARKVRIIELDGDNGKQPEPAGKSKQSVPAAPVGPAKGVGQKAVPGPLQEIAGKASGGPGEQPGEKAAGGEKETAQTKAEQARERAEVELVRGSLLPVLGEMGVKQHDRGTYFLPVAGDKVVSIDSGEVPVIDLDTGHRVILDVNGKISPETRKLIEQAYPSTKVLSGPAGKKEDLLERVLNTSGYFSVNREAGPVLVGGEEKVRFFGKWVIYKDASRRNVVVINTLSDEEFKIPAEIRDYASRFGIRIIEMGGKPSPAPKQPAGGIGRLGRSYEKLLGILGVGFEKDKVVDLVSLDTMKISYTAPIIVDKVVITGDMPDKTMLQLLEKSGYRVLDGGKESLSNILDALGLKMLGPPVRMVIAKNRAELDLPAVQAGGQIILEQPVDRDIARYLIQNGVKTAVW